MRCSPLNRIREWKAFGAHADAALALAADVLDHPTDIEEANPTGLPPIEVAALGVCRAVLNFVAVEHGTCLARESSG
jgi:hypothetical protein